MTATTFSRPLMLAGSAVAAQLGRAGHWTFARYMQAPLASTGLLAMVTLTALAASNALYFQTVRHPAPFFSPSLNAVQAVPEPVAAPQPQPALERQAPALPPISSETTGSVVPAQPQPMPAVPTAAPAIPDGPVGNRDAFAVQKKLTELGLFNGTVDGFYGPQTAAAIRAFETRNGMTTTGALTPGVIEAILRADAGGMAPAAQPAAAAAAPQPAPVQQQVVVQQPAPQPAAAAVVPQQDLVVGRLPALSPVDQAVDAIGNAAAQTVDSLVGTSPTGRGTPTQATTSPMPPQPLGYAPSAPQPAPVQVASLGDVAPPRPVAAAQQEPAPAQVLASTAPAPVAPANNVQLVSQIQEGLASLGFYHGPIDGHPGDATARAIREFENFHSYRVTGQINPDLVGLLRQAGAAV